MARKQRDYKAEYAAAKQRAARAGYKSEREYKQVRRELNLPRRASPVPKRILATNPILARRRESQRWSDRHSHKDRSRYSRTFTDAEVERYWRAYVEEDIRDPEKSARIKAWLVPKWMTDDEYLTNPSTIPLRR